MFPGFRLIASTLICCAALLGWPSGLFAQGPAPVYIAEATQELPEAPRPQFEVATFEPISQQLPAGQSQDTQRPAPVPAPVQDSGAQGSSSSSPTPATPPGSQESKHQKAEEQIKQQEHQRVMGIIPSFNTSYISDAVSLTASQKVNLAFRSTIDPYTFAIAFIVAGLGEAKGDDPGFGWGPKGYAKRSGAAYLDAFDGTMIGNAFLPVILHQDPRYFRLGHGSVRHRFFYAVATSFICKHDNTGKWEPNYSNVGGNIISGAISNLYYPASNSDAAQTVKSGMAQTFEAGLTVTFEGTFGATLQEFWPDISRMVFHKDPTNGLDAQARAADHARKKAKLHEQ